VAQTWRQDRARQGGKPLRPLDSAALERLALRYVERYATTEAKLRDYLLRKLGERGWTEDGPPAGEVLAALVARMVELRYVDDGAFAAARAGSLARRGYGPRRVDMALRAAGVGEAAAGDARALAADAAWGAALAFARRRRIGPYAESRPDRPAREKAMAALLRAGHSVAHARKIVMADPGDVPEEDV
jgi:regulatory protein